MDETQPFDEEVLFQEFGTGNFSALENEIETRDAPSVEISAPSTSGLSLGPSELWAYFVTVLDHPRFRALPSNQQLLYLQLIRQTYGQGRDRHRFTPAELSAWTGRHARHALATFDALKKLRLVILTSVGNSWVPGEYHVVLMAPDREQVTMRAMGNRIDELSADEREILETDFKQITYKERQDLEITIQYALKEFEDLGFDVPPDLYQKGLLYTFLRRTWGPERLRERFPHWFRPVVGGH